jgi:hypothetical protein
VARGSLKEYSGLLGWLGRRFQPVLSSSIVLNTRLFEGLSSIIALKDRRFVSLSSRVGNWTVEMKASDDSSCSVSWILIYRASLCDYRADDFHHACDGMGKCVVVVKAENGMMAAAYNEDGFTSLYSNSPNLNGFIASIDEDGECGEIFRRNGFGSGVLNYSGYGPVFGGFPNDLYISDDCHQNAVSCSTLGTSYGESGATLFGQRDFQVSEYEVFKIVIG